MRQEFCNYNKFIFIINYVKMGVFDFIVYRVGCKQIMIVF